MDIISLFSYSYEYSYNYGGLEVFNAIWQMLIPFFYLMIFVMAVATVSIWFIFEKHYQVAGWKSIIPIYNLIIIGKKCFGEDKYLYVFLMLVPFLNFPVMIFFMYKFAITLNHSIGMVLLLIFFPIDAYPMIAFSSKTKYIPPVS